MAEPFTKWNWEDIEDLKTFDTSDWTVRLSDELVTGSSNEERGALNGVLTRRLRPVLKRIHALYRQLGEQFVGKGGDGPVSGDWQLEHYENHSRDLIRMIIVSAIAQQPMLLVGPPGTAKSNIISNFCEGLGLGRVGEGEEGNDPKKQGALFQYQLHGFTEPDELLGPVNISKLTSAAPEFERFSKGSILGASVIFLDEVFKANSAVLNALLTIINERRIYEAGKIRRASARIIFGATNRTPDQRQLSELQAFFQRFIIRMRSDNIPHRWADNTSGVPTRNLIPQDRQELLRKGWRAAVQDLRAGYNPSQSKIEQVACLNDIIFLNRVVAEAWGGEVFSKGLNRFTELYHQLVIHLMHADPDKDYLTAIDDRKFIRLFILMRANALFDGRDPDERDLDLLKHTWEEDDEERIEMLSREIDTWKENNLADSARTNRKTANG